MRTYLFSHIWFFSVYSLIKKTKKLVSHHRIGSSTVVQTMLMTEERKRKRLTYMHKYGQKRWSNVLLMRRTFYYYVCVRYQKMTSSIVKANVPKATKK